MSTMLEQAIIDATALREAALKNAEQAVIEKYSHQIKEAVEDLLDDEEEALVDDIDGEEEEELALSSDVVDSVPLAAGDGVLANDNPECSDCVDDEEEIEIDFTELEQALENEVDPEMDSDEMVDREELASEIDEPISVDEPAVTDPEPLDAYLEENEKENKEEKEELDEACDDKELDEACDDKELDEACDDKELDEACVDKELDEASQHVPNIDISGKKLAKLFAKAGWTIRKNTSSHITITKPGKPTASIPNHRSISRGALRHVFKTSGESVSDIMSMKEGIEDSEDKQMLISVYNDLYQEVYGEEPQDQDLSSMDEDEIEELVDELEYRTEKDKNALEDDEEDIEVDDESDDESDDEFLQEELKVDYENVPTGWSGSNKAEQKHAETMTTVAKQDSDYDEKVEKLEKIEKELEDLQTENKKIRTYNTKLYEAVNTLKEKIEETALVNAKLFYQNQALNDGSLNGRQKHRIVESIQKAGSIEEAKTIYETLQSTVLAGSMKGNKPLESLNEVARNRIASRILSSNKTRENDVNENAKNRWKVLAGLSS
jgi:predicted RNA binding protein YcfA (HicA-like mRNA interferase family)